jgi:peptidoglycan/xylan/chitin deacetylase (PgdA/CDA1 family)
MYHDIAPEIADTHITVLRKYYNIISLTDFLEAKKSGGLNTLPPKSLVITFDDGHRNNYGLKPIVEKQRVPVVIFLCAGIVGTNRHFWWQHGAIKDIRSLKSCSDDERLKKLADLGFDESKEYDYPQGLTKEEINNLAQSPFINFQSHSLTHPCLPKCSPDKAFHEISASKRDLESTYSFKIYAFAYPNGDYSDREIAFLKKTGYQCGLTCDPGFNDDATPLYQLKRLSMNSNADINELLVRASGLWAFIKRIIQ